MPIPDFDDKPRESLTLLMAGLLYVLNPRTPSPLEAFMAAESFVQEAERRYGPLE